jgi:glycosyltransferase involved in cell wall biosynthesis
MTSPPRISVITPSLNQASYLERTVTSVLSQGYPNLEYIVIDGGSTDGSADVLERYDGRLAYWVSEPDEGQADAINKGIEAATGDIVSYINSDDFYRPGALAAAADAMADPSVRWVVGRCRYEHADGTLETLFTPQPPSMPRRTMIRESWYVPQASSFWRMDVFSQVGRLRDDLQYVFDLEFGLRCALTGITPVVLDREVAVRYLHEAAKSANPDEFAREFESVRPQLEARFERPGDGIRDVTYRMRRRARRVIRDRTSRSAT